MTVSVAQTAQIVSQHQRAAGDTGSPEVQVALLTANINGVATPVDTGLYPSTSAVATALGGKPLQPEKSFNLSGGGVLRFGRFDLSDRDYAQARKLTGLSAEFLNNRGYSYMLRGSFQTALSNFRKAKALDPQNEVVANNLQILATAQASSRA